MSHSRKKDAFKILVLSVFIGLSFLLARVMRTEVEPAIAAPTSPASAAVPKPALDILPDLVEKILPSVVNIGSTTVSEVTPEMGLFLQFWGIPQERKHTSQGSGFILDKDGFVITNYHVIAGAREVTVTLFDKRQFKAKIIGGDEKYDIALVQLKDKNGKNPTGLIPAELGDSDTVRLAQSVFAVGNPFGLGHSVTRGIVSAKNRIIGQGPFDNFLQTDASINPGNSGGPLASATSGHVLGINTVIFSRVGQSSGVGFAIPINEVKTLIGDLKRYGRVPRPWLGILSERMTEMIQEYYDLGTDAGVLVYNIVQGGPADRADLKQGDIITAFNGQKITEVQELERFLAKLKPNEKVNLSVMRGKKTLQKSVDLQELPKLRNLPAGII